MNHRPPPTTSLLDLRGLPPTPERLLSLVEEQLPNCESGIAIDWGLRFPWSLDGRVSLGAFPESAVDRVGKIVEKAGKRLWFVNRRSLPSGFSAVRGYRALVRSSERGEHVPNPAAAKLVSDLYEDLVSLLPTLHGVLMIGERTILETARALWQPVCTEDGRELELVDAERAEEVGLHCAFDAFSSEADLIGSVEWRREVILDLDERPCSLAFESLNAERQRLWRSIGRCRERVAAADLEPGSRNAELVEEYRSLKACWRDFVDRLERVRELVGGRTSGSDFRHFSRVLSAGPRAEIAELHSRISLFRSGR